MVGFETGVSEETKASELRLRESNVNKQKSKTNKQKLFPLSQFCKVPEKLKALKVFIFILGGWKSPIIIQGLFSLVLNNYCLLASESPQHFFFAIPID